jgi:hypothetical protein
MGHADWLAGLNRLRDMHQRRIAPKTISTLAKTRAL